MHCPVLQLVLPTLLAINTQETECENTIYANPSSHVDKNA